ncbi:MAG: hypothetical protein KAJ36_01895, partial [Candidatus Thorarchaeota archaeon]|nr:hypothetical protein [Candidatus Thorarchaeota archaeon]
MNETLTPERKKRRESIKGLSRFTYSGSLTKEVVEDIVAAAPHVQILNIEIIDDTSFELSILKELKDILMLKILEGPNLTHIKLEGIQELDLLTGFEINVNPESIEEIDLTPLANHPNLHAVTIAGPVENLKGLEALNTMPKFGSIGLYSLDISELDLTALSGCKNLESIYMGDIGPENPTKPYKVTLPKHIPMKVLEISECYSDDLKLEIDFSFLEGLDSLDSLCLANCNLTSFDFRGISSLKRIGKIDLSNNKITHLDITPIREIPMFTEKALGESPFVIDEEVIIQIAK